MPVRTIALTASTVARVSASPGGWNHVAVFNVNGTALVYATLNGVDPVAGANDVYVVPPGSRREMHYTTRTGNDVRLVSSAAGSVEVEFA